MDIKAAGPHGGSGGLKTPASAPTTPQAVANRPDDGNFAQPSYYIRQLNGHVHSLSIVASMAVRSFISAPKTLRRPLAVSKGHRIPPISNGSTQLARIATYGVPKVENENNVRALAFTISTLIFSPE